MEQKKELRKSILLQTRSMQPEARLYFSRLIWNRLEQFDEFHRARVIALYWSLNDEVFTHTIIQKYALEKEILLPAIVENDIEFRRYSSFGQLNLDTQFGINEPTGKAFTNLEKIEIIIVPGVAFDTRCYRLGRGKGFYDRFLRKVATALTIGVCFDHQLLPEIPVEKHDIPVDWVITPSAIHKRVLNF